MGNLFREEKKRKCLVNFTARFPTQSFFFFQRVRPTQSKSLFSRRHRFRLFSDFHHLVKRKYFVLIKGDLVVSAVSEIFEKTLDIKYAQTSNQLTYEAFTISGQRCNLGVVKKSNDRRRNGWVHCLIKPVRMVQPNFPAMAAGNWGHV